LINVFGFEKQRFWLEATGILREIVELLPEKSRKHSSQKINFQTEECLSNTPLIPFATFVDNMSNRIPFYSLEAMHSQIEAKIMERFNTVWKHGRFALGPEVEEFEQAFAAFCGTQHCVGVANGCDALLLSLKAAGIQPGDEVIVPAHTFIATWFAVTAAGGKLVPVDADPLTMNLDPARITSAQWHSAKFILPVHLYGLPTNMDAICRMAELNGVTVIEDNAQAQGATQWGKRTGSFGHLAATSFYPGKNIGALGEAGAITTNNQDFAAKLRKLRNVGGDKRYVHELIGTNSRLDTLQAAFLCVKLAHLEEWNSQRQSIANQYLSELQELDNAGKLQLPIVPEGCTSVWHQFVLRTHQREALMAHLASLGVDTLIHYPKPPHLQQAYDHLGWGPGSFPVAEEIAATCMSLPIYPGLTQEQLARVCECISDFYSAQN
jgi:dTDP-4-amino-4,6-dideoxygalactose transaminase